MKEKEVDITFRKIQLNEGRILGFYIELGVCVCVYVVLTKTYTANGITTTATKRSASASETIK